MSSGPIAEPVPAAPPSRVVRRLRPTPALDGLRGIAVLMVLMSHSRTLIAPGYSGFPRVDQFMAGGYLGVDLFFVLSGFLITALLLSEQGQHGAVRFGSFYGRRALRLLPALFALLAAYAAYNIIAGEPREPMLTTARYALFYMSNWQAAWHLTTIAPGLDHLWSLSIEEQFYLFWPWVLIGLLGIRRSAAFVATVLVAAIFAVAVHRAVMWHDIQPGLPAILQLLRGKRVFMGLDTRVDELLIGCLLASLWVRGRTPTRGVVTAAWVGTITLLLCIQFSGGGGGNFVYYGGYDVIALATALLILAIVDGRWIGNRLLSVSPLRLIGRVSYGLYLWHLPIFYAVAVNLPHEPRIIRVALAFSLTAIAVTASWKFIEQPALRLKRRLERREDVSVDRSSTDAAREVAG